MNILFTAQFLPAYTASRFASALEDAFELSPSAFRIVYTVPYQPASGFAQFYFDPTTAGYAAAAEIAHRLSTQSAGSLLAFFDIAALSGQPMLPPAPTDMTTIPLNTTTVPANFTTTFAPAPTNYTVAPSSGTNYTTPSTTTGTAPSTTTAAPPIAGTAPEYTPGSTIVTTVPPASSTGTVAPTTTGSNYYTTPSTTGGTTPTTAVPPALTIDSSVNLVFTCEVDAATFDLPTFVLRIEAWLGNGTQVVIDSVVTLKAVSRRRQAAAAATLVVKFHFVGANAVAQAHRFAGLPAEELSVSFAIKSLSVTPQVTLTAVPSPAPTSTPASTPALTFAPPSSIALTTPSPPPSTSRTVPSRAYVPTWDNIEFNALFASQADSVQLQAHVTAWAQVWVGRAATPIEATWIGPSQQSWHFTGANGTGVGHAFYAQTDDELMDRFGIQRFSVTWIVPQPIDFSPTDNIKFTLTFSSFREISFRTGLAQLLGIARVDDLELSIIPGRVLESGAQLVYCQFSGPNAVTNAHQLLAMPQSVLLTLGIVSRSASPIGPPPSAVESGSPLKWALIGVGCGVGAIAIAICVVCAVRNRQRLCVCCRAPVVATLAANDPYDHAPDSHNNPLIGPLDVFPDSRVEQL
jgi:hypothetical protein